MVSSPIFFFLNYESMTTHLQESWKIQNKVKCYSVAESCWTLCDLTDCSMPGFPVLHGFLEFAHTHVHWVGDAVSHFSFLQSFPASGFFQWVSSPHQVAKVLGPQLHHQSFQWIFWIDFLDDWLVWSPCSPADSQESSPVPQFESINSSVFSLLYGPTLPSVCDYWKNHSFDKTNLNAV